MKSNFIPSLLMFAASLVSTGVAAGQQQTVGNSFLKVSTGPTAATTATALPYEDAGASVVSGCDSCGTSYASSCGCGSRFGGGLLSFPSIQRSEGCYDCFISPISNPVYFEDPRLTTEAKAIFLQHRVPQAAGGGAIQLYAFLLRARLSENVALIATKDGYAVSSNALIDDGWADVAAGLKFALFRNPQKQRLTSAGFTFELPSGEAKAFQGNGSGNLNLFYTSGRKIFDSIYWISGGGIRVPFDTVDESTVMYSSQHFSKNIGPRTWILTEFNMQNWVSSGGGGIPGVEGGDLFNFGSTGVSGNTIVTQAIGLKFKPQRNQEVGAAFEFPLTDRRDVIDNRINVNWIWRY
ncbi:MAG: hypothetical protein R3C03_08165 [Pirellulaceae bacterium]